MSDSSQSGVKWGSLIAGILFVLVSMLSLQNPLASIISFAMFLAISVIVKGVFEILFRNEFKELTGYKSYLPIILGVINIIVGLYFIFNPVVAVGVTPFIFAIWFISYSVCRLFTLDIAKRISEGYYWFSLVINILGIILGILLLLNPISAALTLSFLISLYFMVYGIDAIVYAFK